MGLFNDFLKIVESGDLEAKLASAADTVERVLDTASQGLDKAEQKVSGIAGAADAGVKKFEDRATEVGGALDKAADKLNGVN